MRMGCEAAAVREDLREGLAGLHETPAGFLQRKCRAACPLGDQRVVNHELCMGRHTAIVAAHKDHGAHGRGEFQTDGADGARCEAHGVIDRKARSHASAGAGDKYGDGAAGVGGIEQADLLA